MLTKIEQGYVDQGYSLPKSYTWDLVHQARERYEIAAYMVPVATAIEAAAQWYIVKSDTTGGTVMMHRDMLSVRNDD